MQAQTALATALTTAGIRPAVHRKMKLDKSPLTIVFLVKNEDELLKSAQPFDTNRTKTNQGRSVYKLQGNIKLGESVLDKFIPSGMKVISGCGGKGDRMRVVFAMSFRGEVAESVELTAEFAKFANKGYDFYDLYDNKDSGYLMQLRGENDNNAGYFIEA